MDFFNFSYPSTLVILIVIGLLTWARYNAQNKITTTTTTQPLPCHSAAHHLPESYDPTYPLGDVGAQVVPVVVPKGQVAEANGQNFIKGPDGCDIFLN
jgi:hypothetical protein